MLLAPERLECRGHFSTYFPDMVRQDTLVLVTVARSGSNALTLKPNFTLMARLKHLTIANYLIPNMGAENITRTMW